MGIGGFRLSDKTSTQTDNATGGQTEGPKERQRDPGEDKGPWGAGTKGLKECL